MKSQTIITKIIKEETDQGQTMVYVEINGPGGVIRRFNSMDEADDWLGKNGLTFVTGTPPVVGRSKTEVVWRASTYRDNAVMGEPQMGRVTLALILFVCFLSAIAILVV